MPFHRLYCSPNLYTKEEKHEIARAITGVYTRLPPFYVVVNFIEVEKDNFFVSGEPEDRFLRIVVGHLAYITERRVDNLQRCVYYLLKLPGVPRRPEHKRNFMERYEKAIEPFTKSKGIRWEVSITNDDVSTPSTMVEISYSSCCDPS